MAINYWYIDDSPRRDGIAKNLFTKDKLEIEPRKPETWHEITLKAKETDFDGLLLDWQLEEEVERGDYSSAPLAQQLRVLATEHKIKAFPIILCSAHKNFNKNFIPDLTTHDLFDMVYSKNDLKKDSTQNEFIALANGYIKLNETSKKSYTILHISESDYFKLDIRFQAELDSLMQSPSHEIARFLLRELIEHQGILIDEDVLAARLGINKSSDDWEKLKEKLSSLKYKGVFGEAWERWWWFEIENWWRSNFTGISLRSSTADVRVENIKQKINLQNLVPCIKTAKSKGSSFWTVCWFSKSPLDTIDGFTLLKDETIKAWQEKRYISLDYALEERKKVEKEISTIEMPRFNKLKQMYDNR
ncbi:MAG: hypothetical protein EAZ31_07530 [Cytophagia bacterium]|nr:MAG: hypothetical protein EAZ31_07530 [Cytophagia bacterium]